MPDAKKPAAAKPKPKSPELDFKSRKLELEVKLAEIKYQTLTGQLVNRADRDNAEIARIQAARAHILTIPARVQQLGLDKAIVTIVKNIVNQSLSELAGDIAHK